MPAAIGSQVGGSIIRPAAYCGNFALKPSQGGIHRGERQATSMSTHGPHAGSIEDMWQVAIEVASRCGGDPGRAGIQGPMTTPAATRPSRLILLETDGWARTDADSHAAMAALLDSLQAAGVEILRRGDHPLIESLEQTLVGAGDLANTITAWENRWTLRNLIDNRGEGVSERIKARIGSVEVLSPDDYRQLLLRRETLRAAWRMLAPLADAFLTFSCPGPAPLWPGDIPGQPLAPRPTGDAVFNTPSSLAGAPAVTMPMLAVNGLPVGVQVMGQDGQDARMTAIARWIHTSIEPAIVS
jgi:Asp-tRNA(Asn)/Glu-tRNA(Gln) amidotransferase A subunit family amidase